MLLGPGEQIVKSGLAESEQSGHGMAISLTNHRLVVESFVGGGLFRDPRAVVVLDVPIWAIYNAQTVRKTFGRPVLHLQTTQRSIGLKTQDADDWVAKIASLRATVQMPPPPGYGPTAAPVVVNVQTAAMPPPPPPPPPPKTCAYCGRVNPGEALRCSGCSASSWR